MKNWWILLFLIPSVLAYEYSEQLIMKVNVNSTLLFHYRSSNAYLSSVSFSTGLFPKDNHMQEVLSIYTQPESYQKDERLHFKWDHPSGEVLTANSETVVKTKYKTSRIRDKVPFPQNYVDQGYLQTTENIDADNPDIVELASGLAEGHDDLARVIFEQYRWVRENIDYNLSTLTASASRPASWVLENRYGVCDEITTLFMAMCRSLGIPARYASGIAFTDYMDINDWRPHGWAEVYFPDYGWVPFDLTYNQFGYVDATHVVFGYDSDTNQSESVTNWRGNGVALTSSGSVIDTIIMSRTPLLEDNIAIKITPMKQKVGYGSYNLIETEVTNLRNHYIARTIRMANTIDLDIEEEKSILLEPGQTKKLYWIVRVGEDLLPGYIYNFPIVLYSGMDQSNSSFQASGTFPMYSYDEIDTLKQHLSEEERLNYSSKIEINCSVDSPVYVNEKFRLTCHVLNKGNVYLRDLEVCLDETCVYTDIPLSKSETVSFTLKPQKIGLKQTRLIVKNQDLIRVKHVEYNVVDRPQIIMQVKNFTDNISYKEPGKIVLFLERNSSTIPENVTLIVQGDLSAEFNYPVFRSNKELVLNFHGNQLKRENEIFFVLIYNGKTVNDKIRITRQKLTPFEKVVISIKELSQWIRNIAKGSVDIF